MMSEPTTHPNHAHSRTPGEQPETKAKPRRTHDVFKAWGHVASEAYRRGWARALSMLALALLNTATQLMTIAIILGVVQSLSSDGVVEFFGHQFLIPMNRDSLYWAVAAVIGSLLLAAVIQYAVGLLKAHYRRAYFAQAIRRLLSALDRMCKNGSATGFHPKFFGRMMRRECRYVSRSYVEALGIIPPTVTFAGIFVFAALNFPTYAGLLAFVLVLSAPMHLWLTTWGAGVSRNLLRSGQRKARADQAMIARMTSHPYAQDFSEADFEAHVVSPDVAGFLDAYKNRMRIGILSQLASALAGVLMLTVVIIVFVEGYLRQTLDLSGAVFVVLALRMLLGSAAAVAQGFAMVGSYQPFMESLLKVFENDGRATTPRTLTHPAEGSVVAVFDPAPLSMVSARQLHLDFRPTKIQTPATLVLPNHEPLGATPQETLGLPPQTTVDDLVAWLPALSEINRACLQKYFDAKTVSADDWAAFPPALKAAFSMKSAIESGNASIIALPGALQTLSPAERSGLLALAGRRLIVLLFQAAPKKFLFANDIDMYAADGDQLVHLGKSINFTEKRTEISDFLAIERRRLEAHFMQFDEEDDDVA